MLYYTILDYLQRLVAMRELLKKSTFVPAKGTVATVVGTVGLSFQPSLKRLVALDAGCDCVAVPLCRTPPPQPLPHAALHPAPSTHQPGATPPHLHHGGQRRGNHLDTWTQIGARAS
jgi:hypothetical protein